MPDYDRSWSRTRITASRIRSLDSSRSSSTILLLAALPSCGSRFRVERSNYSVSVSLWPEERRKR